MLDHRLADAAAAVGLRIGIEGCDVGTLPGWGSVGRFVALLS